MLDATMKRGKHNDRAQVLADPDRPEALVRYAAALGKTLRSAQPVPVLQPILVADAVLHCSPEQAGTAAGSGPPKTRWQFIAVFSDPWCDPNAAPWPELPLAPALCA